MEQALLARGMQVKVDKSISVKICVRTPSKITYIFDFPFFFTL